MFKALKRWWKYLGAKVNSVFNAKADPKNQRLSNESPVGKALLGRGQIDAGHTDL